MTIDRRHFLKRLGLTASTAMMSLDSLTALADRQQSSSAQSAAHDGMTLRTQNRTGERVSLLGFGMMRLPAENQELVNKMVDYALDHGVNYFDTAPIYSGGRNEAATGAALSRHPRGKYFITTKMSNYGKNTWPLGESKKIYEKSFRDLRVKYIDNYLMHGVGQGGMDEFRGRFLDNGLLDFLLKEREAGRIRHLGFSYHGDVRVFDWLIDHNKDYHWDLVQIQMNFLDWRHASLSKGGWKQDADAEYLYGKLEKAGIQVVVMEPLRGGSLAQIPKEYSRQLQALRPDASAAEWAFRWVGSHPNILTTLSGMNKMEHLVENVKTHSPLVACTDAENELLERIADGMAGIPTVPCTTCAYCMPCPHGVDIPGNFSFYNKAVNDHLLPLPETSDSTYAERKERFIKAYRKAIPAERRAYRCTNCEVCLSKCPQQIRIPNQMARLMELIRNKG